MALSVGTDLVALLTAAPPDAGSRRAAASPATMPSALPQGFAELLAGLGEDRIPADPNPTSAQPVVAPMTQRPLGQVTSGMEWPWASLAAAAEEATALASQFQRPSADTAMPAEDAGLPQAPQTTETAEPMVPPLAALVAQAALHPLPPLPPLSGAPATSLAEPDMSAPEPAGGLASPAEPATQSAAQMAPQSLTEGMALQMAKAPQPGSDAPRNAAKGDDAVASDAMGARTDRPVPAMAAMSQPVVAPLAAAPSAPAQQAAEAVMAEVAEAAVAAAPDSVNLLPQRRPAEPRRSASQDAAAAASVSVRTSGQSHPPLRSFAMTDALTWEEPVEPETASGPLQPGRVLPPVVEPVARLEPAGEIARAAVMDAMPATPPALAAPEPRVEAARQAASLNPAPSRPHLPPEATQQLALRVVTAAANRVESVSVDLRPPELGRVELRLTFHDGSVQVSMAAERSDTFEALRQDRTHLEQQMQQAGLQLSSGGLDLQHGHLPREAPEPRQASPVQAEHPEAPEDEAEALRRPPSDSLIDLIA